ncbi:MAG: SPOR domain-containing protein [Pseudomonadaceae bacterium]|nr:SPOR domain-containing protein [Pseudomonadaceae bacterium]
MARNNSRSKNKGGNRRSGNKRNAARQPLIHGPSVLLGLALGAIGVLAVLYGPALLQTERASEQQVASEGQPVDVTFEFPDILRDASVGDGDKTGDNADGSLDPSVAEALKYYELQAGAFRDKKDADRLRARLLLLDLPVRSNSAMLDNGEWHRVILGPFEKRIDAQRALTGLREQNIAPLWIERPGSPPP